jgi:hypothetical protein
LRRIDAVSPDVNVFENLSPYRRKIIRGIGLLTNCEDVAQRPLFDIDTHKIDGKPFVRVTFPDGKEETVYGFNARADAIRWIRCEAVVWLWQRREKAKAVEARAR